jgi:hypothetical protein
MNADVSFRDSYMPLTNAYASFQDSYMPLTNRWMSPTERRSSIGKQVDVIVKQGSGVTGS